MFTDSSLPDAWMLCSLISLKVRNAHSALCGLCGLALPLNFLVPSGSALDKALCLLQREINQPSLLEFCAGKRLREEDTEAGEILENAQMSDIYRARAKQRNRV